MVPLTLYPYLPLILELQHHQVMDINLNGGQFPDLTWSFIHELKVGDLLIDYRAVPLALYVSFFAPKVVQST